ncbi:MAG: metalloregulator ArsR/SmtB family transcription factor [Desulfobacteraceae bacterium]|jgi:ubiquinone/menaquinone biosynthesis C-methylase UbiE/DNA-binding transcriptional ArsR family regulator|nr:metalloregulator ArsR/SmtB family transcription factor [Desulfobacteraceae bacterium]
MICLTYFKALADETRVRLLNILMHHEMSVNEIVALMDMGQSRISRHLKVLTDSGLLECRRDGAWAFYSAVGNNDAGRFSDSIRPLFLSEQQLAGDLETASHLVTERSIKSRNFFNSIASEWNYLKQKVLGDFDLNQAILDCVDTCQFAVDLGCGTGELLAGLRKKAGFAVGIDSSRKMLAQAEKLFSNNDKNIELRLGELEHLPVGNNEADFAVISMVMHHLANPEKVAMEVARILKSGGIFIIADFEKHTNEEMRKKYGDRWLGFSKDEIRTILSPSGFEEQKIKAFKLKQSINLNITIARKK